MAGYSLSVRSSSYANTSRAISPDPDRYLLPSTSRRTSYEAFPSVITSPTPKALPSSASTKVSSLSVLIFLALDSSSASTTGHTSHTSFVISLLDMGMMASVSSGREERYRLSMFVNVVWYEEAEEPRGRYGESMPVVPPVSIVT